MLPVLLWLYFLMAIASGVRAQFSFFDMFGQGHQQQQQRPTGGAEQWVAQAESAPCSQYLCPRTLACVAQPSLCPCPDVQDIRCLIPDAEDKAAATVLCVRGAEECANVNRLARALSD